MVPITFREIIIVHNKELGKEKPVCVHKFLRIQKVFKHDRHKC